MIQYIRDFFQRMYIPGMWFWYMIVAVSVINFMVTFLYFDSSPKKSDKLIQMEQDIKEIMLTLDEIDDMLDSMIESLDNSKEVLASGN